MKRSARLLPRLACLAAALVSAHSALALTAEQWNGLSSNPSLLNLQRQGIAKRAPDSFVPAATAAITALPSGTGLRLRALLTPPTTGSYTLYISGAKNAALWLSSDASRFGKQRVAWHYETTGAQQWTKFATQTSSPVNLTAGIPYYIEAQVMSSVANGHIALGWKGSSTGAVTLIPIQHFDSLPADPADLNDNNLPDAWEAENGLDSSILTGARAEHGDPDKDGRSNYEEYRSGTDPLFAEALSAGLTRDIWTEIQGQQVSRLTGSRSRFLFNPNATDHVARISENSPNKPEGKDYGARYHGYLIAPVTGIYHLWVAGDDEAELWFADGTVIDPATSTALTNQPGKQLLAHTRNPGGNYRSYPWDYDLLPSQCSRALHLTAGQSYFIEVLHKNESISGNHVSLAWQIPGQARVVVPATALRSGLPDPIDADNDALPDAWETSVGLIPWNNGAFDGKEGQYGDQDNDGLSNLTEFQIGTNPKAADTDGDTLSDSQEINYYLTDPLISNLIASTLAFNINHATQAASSVAWQTRADGSILAHERCGWTDWTFTVPAGQEGYHEIRLVGGAEGGAVRSKENLPLSFGLDGRLIGRQNMACVLGQNTTVKQLTPWLTAGMHTLRVQNHNVRANCKLRINSINIHRLGGADANSNGLVDWAETKYANEYKLTCIPSQSLTSPASIEGITASLPALKLTYLSGASVPPASELPALPGIDSEFYTNLPLDPTQATQLSVSFQGGANPSTHSVTWAATNILEHNALTIRQGDSLRLTAHDPAASPTGTFTLGGATLLSLPTESQPADQPHVITFDAPGIYTLNATWTPPDGPPQTGTLTVTVASANFGPAFIVETYNRRTWNIPGVSGMDVEADSALFWDETTAAGAAPRSFLVNAYNAGTYRVIARVPATGEIITSGEVSAFSLTRANATADAQIVQIRPDGSRVIRFTIVAENLPPNAEIRIHLNYQGSIFSNGGRDLILHPSDFTTHGVANIYVETSSNPPQLCHSMSAFLLD